MISEGEDRRVKDRKVRGRALRNDARGERRGKDRTDPACPCCMGLSRDLLWDAAVTPAVASCCGAAASFKDCRPARSPN